MIDGTVEFVKNRVPGVTQDFLELLNQATQKRKNFGCLRGSIESDEISKKFHRPFKIENVTSAYDEVTKRAFLDGIKEVRDVLVRNNLTDCTRRF